MLIRDTKEVYRSRVRKAVGENATADDVLDYLFDYGNEDFVIREWRDSTTTVSQRLNMCWAVPLTLVCAPVQYILCGRVGWDTKTAFGRWILRVTGHLGE